MWEQLKYSLTDGWITNEECQYNGIYDLAVNRNEVLMQTSTWVKFESIMPSGRSQSQIPHII